MKFYRYWCNGRVCAVFDVTDKGYNMGITFWNSEKDHQNVKAEARKEADRKLISDPIFLRKDTVGTLGLFGAYCQWLKAETSSVSEMFIENKETIPRYFLKYIKQIVMYAQEQAFYAYVDSLNIRRIKE